MDSEKKDNLDTSPEPSRILKEVPSKAHNFPLPPEPLPVPEGARSIQRAVVDRLESLVSEEFSSALDPAFQAGWQEVLALADRYQEAITRAAGRVVTCAAGCSSCCCHWVEDVNSFEAEAIAAWLKRSAPQCIPTIIDRCNRDGAALSQLNAIVEAKLAMIEPGDGEEGFDATDLLLASFHRLKKPCPLLDGNTRSCLVYHLRPLTCRMYVSFSNPVKCSPGRADDADIPTYLFDLEERADELIDRLHFKFLKFEGDAGLRSLLVKYCS